MFRHCSCGGKKLLFVEKQTGTQEMGDVMDERACKCGVKLICGSCYVILVRCFVSITIKL